MARVKQYAKKTSPARADACSKLIIMVKDALPVVVHSQVLKLSQEVALGLSPDVCCPGP